MPRFDSSIAPRAASRILFARLAKVLAYSVLTFGVTACANKYALVKHTDISLAEQCMTAQQDEIQRLQAQQAQIRNQQQQLTDQREQFTHALDGLNNTFASLLAANLAHTPEPRPPTQRSCAAPPNMTKTVPATVANNKQLVGATEQVWFPKFDMTFESRIDTGAATSSLNADNITVFERDGQKWVRFDVPQPGSRQPVTIERKQARSVRIRQSTSGESQRRPVVKLRVVIGHISQEAEFNLTNRTDMEYRVLIGRNVLRDLMVVDVSKKDIAPPQKDTPSKRKKSA